MLKLYFYAVLTALICGISNVEALNIACLNECTTADEFATTLSTAVLSSPTAKDAFDCSDVTPLDFSQGLYNYIRNNLNQNGVPGSDFLAKITVAPIAENFQTFTPTFILELYAKTMAKILINEGILNAGNAAILAKAFFDKIIESANLNCDKTGTPYKTTTIFDAYKNFLTPLGLYTAEKIPDGCFVFKSEAKSAASLSKITTSVEFDII
ncbi:hypothetical protein CDAR_621511 [Caerostris darwini]|uniref:Uncharacterized protein n=1 Tax=Caerostris darwini TaxID=1538125 RepID=A0AAV4VC74_9ARAC|nr:hypothetical protein CDAR_621511 [Caerostris darwini]